LKDEELHIRIVDRSFWYFPKVAILDPMLLKGLLFGQAGASGVETL
jgi:hypothetical protein